MDIIDIIDICVITSTLVYISALIVSLGTECAERVWDRCLNELDYLDLIEGNTVPFTHTSEAILITVAATLKIFAYIPVNFVKALIKPRVGKTPEMRMSELKQRLRKDILLAVRSMIAGYPERASMGFTDQWIARQQGSYNPLVLEQETAVQK